MYIHSSCPKMRRNCRHLQKMHRHGCDHLMQTYKLASQFQRTTQFQTPWLNVCCSNPMKSWILRDYQFLRLSKAVKLDKKIGSHSSCGNLNTAFFDYYLSRKIENIDLRTTDFLKISLGSTHRYEDPIWRPVGARDG